MPEHKFVKPPESYWHSWHETRFINRHGFPDVLATQGYGPADKIQHEMVRRYQTGHQRFAITLKAERSYSQRHSSVKYTTVQEVGDKDWYEGMTAIFEIHDGDDA